MKKVTSVEWLVEELRKYEFLGTFCTPEELENKKKHVESIVEQAKEMEKEQIINAYQQAEMDNCKIWLHGDLYYNKTFKSE